MPPEPRPLAGLTLPSTQVCLLAIFAFVAVLTPVCLFLGVRGFAPTVGVAGVACLAFARPSPRDWPGIGLLLLLVLWAVIGLAWTPAPNLHGLGSFKTVTRATFLHLALQSVLCTALVTAVSRMERDTAERALTWLAFALLGGLALLTEEGLSHAALYQAMMAAAHDWTRPDMAVRALAQGGYVTAVLTWPLGVALRRQGRVWTAVAIAAFVPLSLVLMRGFAPSAGLAISLPVFLLVRRFGRPAIMAMMALTAAYMLLTPLLMLAIDHFGLYAQFKPHLPPSWGERLRIWSFVAHQFVQHPLRGAGLDASRTFPGVVPLHPHNGPLQLWYELGAPGALLGTGFWVWLWFRIAARAQDARLFASVASATAAVYIIISAVGFGLWQEWWLCVGALAMSACVVLAKTLRSDESDSSATGHRRRALSPAERRVLLIILGFVAVRLIASACMGLGMDESYSTAVSRDLHLSYFDHPPMHQWLAHLGGEAFGYGRWTRLPFIALFAGSSWLMFRLAARLFGEVAGVWAVLALNLSAFFTLAAGEWVLPDGPLIFCELAAALCLARVFFPATGESARGWLWWLGTGLWLGLAALSKYQAATVGLGFGLFVLTTPAGRAQLRTPGPYLAKLLILLIILPVLIWNAQHQWISFTFQAARGAPRHLSVLGPLIGLAGQAALLSPWVAAPLVWAGYGAVKAGRGDPRAWFCLMAAGPTIVLFTLLPLFGSKVLPHWPMPGWLMLFPVLGDALARSGRAWPVRWAAISAGLLLAFWALAISDAATAWVRDAFPRAFPKTDPSYEAIDWAPLRGQLQRAGLLGKPEQFVVAVEWNEAGKIDQALGDLEPVVVFNADPREYAFRADAGGLIGHDALIIGRGPSVAQELSKIAPHFASLTPVSGFSVGRRGKPEIPLTVIVAHDLLTPYPQPSWARR